MVGSVALGRFGHSVTSLGDLNNDGCDGQHLPVVMMCVQWWIVLQILLLVLHLMKEEKCSFTMGLIETETKPSNATAGQVGHLFGHLLSCDCLCEQ